VKDYIGDGVYVEYDGFGIVLNANDATNPTDSIYLEPEVCSRRIRFIQRVQQHDIRFPRLLEKTNG
jgi:hypothetical protein